MLGNVKAADSCPWAKREVVSTTHQQHRVLIEVEENPVVGEPCFPNDSFDVKSTCWHMVMMIMMMMMPRPFVDEPFRYTS